MQPEKSPQAATPHAATLQAVPRPDPRILSNSGLWQSERWKRAVEKIASADSFSGTAKLALELVRRRSRYDAVYTVGVREAQMYGLLCLLAGTGSKPHIAAEILLDEPNPESLGWRIKRWLRRLAFRRVSNIIVFSDGERELYSAELKIPLAHVDFVPFHTNVLEPQILPRGAYGVAAGRSLRDYKTFFAAVARVDYPFIVVADRASVAGLDIPSNVEMHYEIPRAHYLEIINGSRFVVAPVKCQYRSTGQVVILEAASLGKPVITHDVIGTRDYVTHDVDGLLARPEDPEDLRLQIERVLTDDALCERLAAAALARVLRENTFDIYVDRCLAVVNQAVRS